MSGDTPATALAAFGRFVDSIISSLTQKQEVLVSGNNIKTLNGESLLGSGNVSIVGIVDPSTNDGDLIVNVDGTPTRLAKGIAGTMLLSRSDSIGYGNNPVLGGYSELIEVITEASGAVILDVSVSNVKRVVMDGATTFTFSGTVVGRSHSMVVYLEGGDAYTPTFPASVKWLAGAPTLSAKDRLMFETFDNGVTWLGTHGGSYA